MAGFHQWCKASFFLTLLFIAFAVQGCRSSPVQQDKEPHSPRIVDELSDSLARTVGTEPLASAARSDTPHQTVRTELLTSEKPLPPPKKEAWMDTLSDLTGVPAPNAAVLIDADPVPQNLQSVAILIAQRYRPKKEVEMTFRLLVTETGTVRRYQLLRTSDPKLTVEYFAHPLLELRFSPATHGGRPVSAWTTISLKIPTAL